MRLNVDGYLHEFRKLGIQESPLQYRFLPSSFHSWMEALRNIIDVSRVVGGWWRGLRIFCSWRHLHKQLMLVSTYTLGFAHHFLHTKKWFIFPIVSAWDIVIHFNLKNNDLHLSLYIPTYYWFYLLINALDYFWLNYCVRLEHAKRIGICLSLKSWCCRN